MWELSYYNPKLGPSLIYSFHKWEPMRNVNKARLEYENAWGKNSVRLEYIESDEDRSFIKRDFTKV